MLVGRFYLNLTSSDITWNQLLSEPPLLLVSENFEEENGDDE